MPTKKKPVVEPVENPDEEPADVNESNPLVDATRKILLAGIGAIAIGKDEIEDFINKLVERGEIAEKDGRNLFSEVLEKRKKSVRSAEDMASKHVHDILDRLSVPTKKDIEDLSEKVASLTKKVEELTKNQS